jgi:hypothetical protein
MLIGVVILLLLVFYFAVISFVKDYMDDGLRKAREDAELDRRSGWKDNNND